MDDHLIRNSNTNAQTVDRMSRVTLNAGFIKDRDAEEDRLVAEFLAKNKVTKCPPAGVTGNEASRHTNEHIAKERRKFRKTNKPAK